MNGKKNLFLNFLAAIMVLVTAGGAGVMAKAKTNPNKMPSPPATAEAAENGVEMAGDLPAGLDPDNTLILKLKDGEVMIKLRPDLAPKTVKRFKQLVATKFYDGLTFHRVIDGFMAQTGDPNGDGTGGSGVNVPAEFTRETFKRGTLGMARSNDPNSGDSQFFICFAAAAFLDGKYTVFGEVVSGMEFVDKIKRGTGGGGQVSKDPDKIISLRLAAAAS
ncbi:MAG: peptidylprolyl isomerase [Candidatus Symbiobacter sp.]|nr:peptidylprolyl isomerase [Candidatus Symbiobacter sp.]